MTEYVILDGRAHGDPDDATVLVWCPNLADAINYRKDFPGGVLAECHENGPLVVVPWPQEVPRG